MTDKKSHPSHEEQQKKKELEQHEVTQVLDFLKHYGKLIGAGLAAATVAILLSRAYATHKATKLAEAEAILINARTPQELSDVVDNYGSTPAAPVALLDLAKMLYNDGNIASAREHYERFLKKYKNNDLSPMAEFGLAYCTEADGNFSAAADEFAAFNEKYSGHFLNASATLAQARCLEEADRIDEARIVLEDFLAANEDSSWAGTAEDALQQLGE